MRHEVMLAWDGPALSEKEKRGAFVMLQRLAIMSIGEQFAAHIDDDDYVYDPSAAGWVKR